jgi:endoglucanase
MEYQESVGAPKKVRRLLLGALALAICAACFAGGCITTVVLGGHREAPTQPREAKRGPNASVTTGTIRSATPGVVFRGGLLVEPWGAAATAARGLHERGHDRQGAAAEYIAQRPVAVWLSSYYDEDELRKLIDRDLERARNTDTTAVFVTYDIPNRDCGGKSAGGAKTMDAYLTWNRSIANQLQGNRAVVLVEPDSVGQISSCPGQTVGRLEGLRAATRAFHDAGIPAYLDGGNSSWVRPSLMETRLRAAGIGYARGFFTNVANYQPLKAERRYAETLASSLGDDVHYVIDTGRNGQGWKGTWCNAEGAGLGRDPEVATRGYRLDAFLWVKTPGASDGRCTGGPAPGRWFAEYAEQLVRNKR